MLFSQWTLYSLYHGAPHRTKLASTTCSYILYDVSQCSFYWLFRCRCCSLSLSLSSCLVFDHIVCHFFCHVSSQRNTYISTIENHSIDCSMHFFSSWHFLAIFSFLSLSLQILVLSFFGIRRVHLFFMCVLFKF